MITGTDIMYSHGWSTMKILKWMSDDQTGYVENKQTKGVN